MRTKRLAVAALVALCFSGFATQAQAEKGDMQIRFGVLYSMPTSDLSEPGETLELDEAFGYQGSFEFLLTDLIGIEPAISGAKHDVCVEEQGGQEYTLGDINVFMLGANVNFHLLRRDRIDLYVGPTIAYAFWGDLKTSMFPDNFPAEDDFVFGANVGIDIPFGSGQWAFNAALTYLAADVTLEGNADEPDLGVDPIQIKAGLRYRF